jgi:hypothetical protein
MVGLVNLRLLTLAGLSLATAACQKPQPSPEYGQALVLHARLTAAQSDDAYLSAQMEEVEALLSQVPAQSSDRTAAIGLAAQIQSERRRVQNENETRRREVAAALIPSDVTFDRPPGLPPVPTEQAPAPVVDAGVDAGVAPQPRAGMALQEFTHRFSGCFTQAASVELAGKGQCDTYELKNIANCRDRHPGFDEVLVVIFQQKIFGVAPKSSVRMELRPAAVEPTDAGQE